jgi:hypothetical protein
MISNGDEYFNFIHYLSIYIKEEVNRLNDPI